MDLRQADDGDPRPRGPALPRTLALQALEHMARGGSSLPARQLLAGFILRMVYGSLRFDDALHVCPAELQFRGGNLRGRVWQTKVDRKRKGTVFVAPNVSLTSTPWLVQWFNFSMEHLSEEADFWLPHTDGRTFFDVAKPAVFASSLAAMRELLHWCKEASGDEAWNKVDPDKVTWHSARCTVPSWAGEAGRPSVEILMQMHSS